VTPIHLEANILKRAGDRGFVPKDRQYVGNGLYGGSNGHLLDDVTHPVTSYSEQITYCHSTEVFFYYLNNSVFVVSIPITLC